MWTVRQEVLVRAEDIHSICSNKSRLTMCHPVHIKYRQKQEHNERVLDPNRRVCEKNRRFIGKTNRLG